jgi:prepilin-type processing-associated H-X9-DG protein
MEYAMHRIIIAILVLTWGVQLAGAEEPHPKVVAGLKKLHTAFESYRKDHKSAYPPLATKQADGSLVLWPELLKPYLKDTSPAGHVDVQGPFFPPYVAQAERRRGKATTVSFGYSRYALGANAPSFKRNRQLVRAVPHPAKTILLVECDTLKKPGSGWYAAYPNGGMDFARYKGKAHVLFCDGHVELWDPAELNVGKKVTTPMAPWFGDLSRKKTPAAPPKAKPKASAMKPGAIDASLPYLTVAPMATPPTIDGTLRDGEWDRASAFSGYSHFVTRRLDVKDVHTFVGYDAKALYLAFLVPLGKGEKPNASITKRDGRLYREDALEIILAPEPKKPLRQIIINPLNTIFDRFGSDVKWQGNWQTATGQGTAADLPASLKGLKLEGFWCVEMALPFAELKTTPPSPGTLWRANFCLDGGRPLVFAPTFDSYMTRTRYAYLRFLGKDTPTLHMPGLGKIVYGQFAPEGHIQNPFQRTGKVRFHLVAQKKGTRIVEKTGFEEIVGARITIDKTVPMAPASATPLRLAEEVADTRLEEMRLRVEYLPEKGKPVLLHATHRDITVLPPFQLTVENYPSVGRLLAHFDATGLTEGLVKVRAECRILNEAGKTLRSWAVPLTSRQHAENVEVAALPKGTYTLAVDLMRQAAKVATAARTFVRPGKPAWFGNDIGKARIVVKPFTPMTYDTQQVGMWGRTYRWKAASLLPSTVTGKNQELLAAPARLLVKVNGVEQTIPLTRFRFTSREKDRAEMALFGRVGNVEATVAAWAEYDGLLWYDLTLRGANGQPLQIDACSLEFPMLRNEKLYYHGVPDRSMNGAIKDKTLRFPYQDYFWIGSCERGLGFVIDSRENLAHTKNVLNEVAPKEKSVVWRVVLRDAPSTTPTLRYRFGLQATPVKPLPPDYHSWMLANYEQRRKGIYSEHTANVDFATIWNHLSGGPETRWGGDGFCDPIGIRTDKLAAYTKVAHKKGTPLIAYTAPNSFTDDARPLLTTYAHEWMVKPRRRWKSVGYVQSRACFNSSYLDFTLHALRRAVREAKLDGLYFDGAVTMQCANSQHGCGWRDAKGNLNPTRNVLANREFNKRIAVMLQQEVEARGITSPAAAGRPGWPKWFCWTHLSGAVTPPIESFNTAYFCGEWFKGPIRQGKGYEDLLTVDTFRPRYLSQPWGVPNAFLPISFESTTGKKAQTELILSYLLTQGVPLYARYLNKDIRRTVVTAMTEFGTRKAEFIPAWRTNPYVALAAGGDANILIGTWARDGRILAVIGNVGKQARTLKLRFPKHTGGRMKTIYPTAKPISVIGDSVVFPIGPRTFRMVELTPAR